MKVVCCGKSEVRRSNIPGRITDRKIFLYIAASVADSASANPNYIKTLLSNILSRFFITGKPIFSNGSKSLHYLRQLSF